MSTNAAPPVADRATRPRGWRRPAALMAALALVGALLALVFPPGVRLGDASGGDPALAAETRAIVGQGRGIPALSLGRIEGGRTTFAGLGEAHGAPPTPDTPFELGSITKTFTGHLLAIAVERGEMRLDDPLSRHLPELAGTPAGAATLRQLATQTSGLPRLPAGMSPWAGLSTRDPYAGWSTARVVDAARGAQVSNPGTRSYSNLGMALLGHAEAKAAGAASWSQLATDRLLRPLGMTSTGFVGQGGAEPAGLATPHWSNGRVVDPWAGDGYAPSGASTRTTARDLAAYAAALLDGTAPGASALRPITDGDKRRGGLAWVVDATDQGPLTWHNGGTGGSSTMLALDLSNKRAALALASSDRNVDEVAIGLLRHDSTPVPAEPNRLRLIALGVGIIGLAGLLWRLGRRPTRISLLTGVLEATAGLVIAWVFGPWGLLPGWVLGALAGGIAGGVVAAALAARHVPTNPETGRKSAIASLLVTVVLVGLLFVVLR